MYFSNFHHPEERRVLMSHKDVAAPPPLPSTTCFCASCPLPFSHPPIPSVDPRVSLSRALVEAGPRSSATLTLLTRITPVMSLRVASRCASRCYSFTALAGARRWCATSSSGPAEPSTSSLPSADEVVVRESPIDGVYLLEMQHATSVAAHLSPSLLSSLLNAIRTVCDPDQGHARGLVITSKAPDVFAGELDVESLLCDDPARFAYYWHQVQQLFVTLHSLPVPCAAAIGGRCATGGSTIALACDYRVMAATANTVIGVTAARDGFCVPPYIAASLERVVGFREAERMLTLGTVLHADAAVACGLVDDVVEAAEEAVVPCLEYVEKVLELPSPFPYWLAKDTLRRRVLSPLCTHALRTEDTGNMHELFQNPAVRSALAQCQL